MRLTRRAAVIVASALLAAAGVTVTLAISGGPLRVGAVAPAPTSHVRICGQPVLDSPWNYDGAAGSYASGTAGLPNYGAPGTDFPSATSGLVVAAGDNTAAALDGTYKLDNTVVYFEPGVHQVKGAIQAGNNSDYVGGYDSATGKAVIDGVNGGTQTGLGSAPAVYENRPAAGSSEINNTWEYLTVENYGAALNGQVMGSVNGASQSYGDTYKYDTIGPNEYGYAGESKPPALNTTSDPGQGGGYAIGGGSYTTIEYDCITQNAQGGFNLWGGVDDVLADNEISWNGLGSYGQGGPNNCGCSGGGKIFFSVNADVVNNYVHDNYNEGIWFDFDNTGELISHNYIADNWSSGIVVEASYNADIADNYLTGNGWASDGPWPAGFGGGTCHGGVSCTLGDGPVIGKGGGFPFAAIYLPNTGGNANLSRVSVPSSIAVPGCASDCTVQVRYAGHFYVQGNVLVNNFGGVMVYSDLDRYPGNIGHDSACSVPLGSLNQPNSTTYYRQTYELITAADTSISGTTVTSAGGTKTLCSTYGTTPGIAGRDSRVPQPATAGTEVFDLTTAKLVGTVASNASSATSFSLTAAPLTGSYSAGDALLLSDTGGCGPADYYGGGPGVDSGSPLKPYWDNCIWGSRNITVSGNQFSMDAFVVTDCTTANMCGVNALIASQPGVPLLMQFWSSYRSLIQMASGGLGNVFSGNAYSWTGGGPGSWTFDAGDQNTFVPQRTWQKTDGQDAGSKFGT